MTNPLKKFFIPLIYQSLLFSLPQAPQIISGRVEIDQNRIISSDRAIINWGEFSIQHGETLQFIQPSSTSTVLNLLVLPALSLRFGSFKKNNFDEEK